MPNKIEISVVKIVGKNNIKKWVKRFSDTHSQSTGTVYTIVTCFIHWRLVSKVRSNSLLLENLNNEVVTIKTIYFLRESN